MPLGRLSGHFRHRQRQRRQQREANGGLSKTELLKRINAQQMDGTHKYAHTIFILIHDTELEKSRTCPKGKGVKTDGTKFSPCNIKSLPFHKQIG